MFSLIDEDLDLTSISFSYVTSAELGKLNQLDQDSFDMVIIFTHVNQPNISMPFKFSPQIHQPYLESIYEQINAVSSLITRTGTLYLYGLPHWLPYFAVYLDKNHWQFKYWLALETHHPTSNQSPMVNTHEGILLYSRSKNKSNLRKVRSPHQKCDVCGDYTADWGGKKHLRNPLGYAISDVWDDLPHVKDTNHILSKEVWQRLVLLTAQEKSRVLCIAYDGATDVERFIFE
jgi:site-specific DNA-methyltransferase (adenine-specific)